MPGDDFGSGRRRCWDGEDCPRDDCDGDLQQQDQYNVMCLSCETVWSHVKSESTHYLQTADFETVAAKPVAMADGGERSEFGKQGWMGIDATEHYRRKARDMEESFIGVGGVLIGAAAMGLFLLLWEMIQR